MNDSETIIQKIKTRGYWRVNFRPITATEKLSLTDCKKIIETNKLMLRGWDYPHISVHQDNGGKYGNENNYFYSWTDWWNLKEYFRMFQSGQFINYFGFYEDWTEEIALNHINIPPNSSFAILFNIYRVTEIYEFLSKIASNSNIYDDGIIVKISLFNTGGRQLWMDALDRVPFLVTHKTEAKDIILPERRYSKNEIITKSLDLALKDILYIFERFGWTPTAEMIRKEQISLLSGK